MLHSCSLFKSLVFIPVTGTCPSHWICDAAGMRRRCNATGMQRRRYLRKLFSKCSETRERLLRSSGTDLKIPLLKTINGQKSVSHRGAKLWKGLEMQTQQAVSLKTFIDQLYTGTASSNSIFFISLASLFCKLGM